MPKISQIATTTLPIVGNEVVVINQGGSTFTAILSSLSVGSGDALTPTAHTHVSADITDAATVATPATLVLRGMNGSGEFSSNNEFFALHVGSSGTGTAAEIANTSTGDHLNVGYGLVIVANNGDTTFTGNVTASNLTGTNTGDDAVNSLYSGLVSNATHTGDVTGATALTIAADAVTNAKLANMATQTIKGRTTAGTGDPEDLTVAQARTMLGATVATPATLVLRGGNGQASFGDSENAFSGSGVNAQSVSGSGVYGTSFSGTGVHGLSVSGTGIYGSSSTFNHADFGNGKVVIANNGDTTFTGNVTAPNLATLTGTQTLTNKTLTNATLNNYTEGVVAIGTVVSAHTIAITSGTIQTATLTASTACAFTMPTATAGKSFILYLKQAAATGNGTATFGASGPTVKWAGGTAPTITATAGKMDILSFVADGSHWYGSVIQNYTP